MNEIEQRERAGSPLEPYRGAYPGRRRRRVVVGVSIALAVVLLAVGSLLFVDVYSKVHHLESTTTVQARQIHRLESELAAQHASLAAAVACLQTAGAMEGLCSQLVK